MGTDQGQRDVRRVVLVGQPSRDESHPVDGATQGRAFCDPDDAGAGVAPLGWPIEHQVEPV